MHAIYKEKSRGSQVANFHAIYILTENHDDKFIIDIEHQLNFDQQLSCINSKLYLSLFL